MPRDSDNEYVIEDWDDEDSSSDCIISIPTTPLTELDVTEIGSDFDDLPATEVITFPHVNAECISESGASVDSKMLLIDGA